VWTLWRGIEFMSQAPKLDQLPRRDFVLIPLIALLTALVIFGGAELLTGLYFSETQQGSCGKPDPILPYRYSANCTFHNKAAEGPLVEYVFNECGYRSRESCGPKAAGTTRIALLGASTAEGFKIAYDDALAPRAAAQLTRVCRRPVEFQNMGIAGFKVIDQYLRLDEALALKPDMVMLVVTPYELVDFADPEMLANRSHPERVVKKKQPERVNEAGGLARISAILSKSRTAVFAQSLLFQNREQYISLFLKHGDKADYLRVPLSAPWEKRLAELELMVGEMADRIHKEGIPFVIVFTPQRIQAALSDPASRPPGVDPTAFGRRIAEMSARHGILFIDTYEAFRQTESPEKLFFPVDGHMTAGGHAVVADAMVRGLLKSGTPAFAGCDAVERVGR
jgi:hypothetical protein